MRKHSAIFIERMRKGHHQLDKQWNYFQGSVEETSERQGEVHIGFSQACKYHLH